MQTRALAYAYAVLLHSCMHLAHTHDRLVIMFALTLATHVSTAFCRNSIEKNDLFNSQMNN